MIALRAFAAFGCILTLALLPVGKAQAQTGPYSCMTSAQWSQASVPAHCTQGLAFSQCMSATDEAVQRLKQQHPSRADEVEGLGCPTNSTTSFRCYARIPGVTETVCNETGGPWAFFKTGTECEYGLNANTPDGCNPSPEECLARNGDAFKGMKLGPVGGYCAGGCMYKPVANGGGLVAVDGLVSSEFAFDGEACPTTAPDVGPEPANDAGEDQECSPAGDGQTFCLKRNGDHCHSASTGRQICWKPGETGEKNDGPVRQKRNAGNEPIPPASLELPNGDTLQQTGQPVTKTTTTNSTTITTTTTNYTTTNGTDANGGGDPADDGEASDGTPDGPGEDDGEGNESGGGGDCDTPPTSSGDPILGNILQQAWRTRCNLEGAVEGSGHHDTVCQDAQAACKGSPALCRILKEERQERCRLKLAREAYDQQTAAMASESDGLEGITEASIWATGTPGDGLDGNLFGGQGGTASCPVPSFTLGGQAFTPFPEQFWTFGQAIRWLLVACAYIWVAALVIR